MNSSVYVFGNLGNGYTQYPDDYAKGIYQIFFSEAKAPSQIAIHRDNNLMYYGYIRKMDKGLQYIGFCVLLNGVMFSQVGSLFPIFENAVTDLVARGEILHFTNRGDVSSSISNLNEKKDEIERIASLIKNQIDNLNKEAQKLPPVSYGTSNTKIRTFSESDKNEDIVKSSYTNGYTFIYKAQGYNTALMNSYQGILFKISKERDDLKTKCSSLSSQLAKAKAQQRNLTWVSIFGAIILILGVVVWNKVLFPSEVTRYQTKEFLYYGPLQNKEPHGEGVAFYPSDDKDGRRYYIGHFVDGNRKDSTAMLYYQNGDYFYGSMDGDKLLKGIFYFNSDHSHFEGSFVNDKPYNGTWYNHEESYKLIDGKRD